MKLFACIMMSILIINIDPTLTNDSKEDESGFTHFDNLVKFVNSMNSTWKAKPLDDYFLDPSNPLTVSQTVKERFKKNVTKDLLPTIRFLWNTKQKVEIDQSLPEKFDAREMWPDCPTIGKVYDIGATDSQWASANAQMISDRICIHSNGKKIVEISASDIAGCVSTTNTSFETVMNHNVLKHYVEHGFVTGGEYGTKIGCKPYHLAKCNHGFTLNHYPICIKEEYEIPPCNSKCTNPSYRMDYEDDLHYGDIVYYHQNVNEIMAGLMLHGPIVVEMWVFNGFYVYESGIYQLVPGETFCGKTSLKLIGWGTENGIDYWLALNSWNEQFGMNGTIKILRGVNEFNIEKNVISVLPKSNDIFCTLTNFKNVDCHIL